jgi:hypothetical protein
MMKMWILKQGGSREDQGMNKERSGETQDHNESALQPAPTGEDTAQETQA